MPMKLNNEIQYYWERNIILAIVKHYSLNMATASLYYTLKRLIVSFVSYVFLKRSKRHILIQWIAAILKFPLFLKKTRRIKKSEKNFLCLDDGIS